MNWNEHLSQYNSSAIEDSGKGEAWVKGGGRVEGGAREGGGDGGGGCLGGGGESRCFVPLITG